MATATIHDYLVRLHDIILEERKVTKELDMDALEDVMREKESLLRVLSHIETLDEGDKELAAAIRNENRRNAYLFKATLGWIRETMEFFGRHGVSSGYSATGGLTNSKINGRLLSGQV